MRKKNWENNWAKKIDLEIFVLLMNFNERIEKKGRKKQKKS